MEVFKPLGFDKGLSIVTVALLAVGFIMVSSSSMVMSTQKYHQPMHFLIEQVIGAVGGLVLAFFVLSIRRPFYQSSLIVHALLGLSVVLLTACFVMPTVARVNRWVTFFGIRFQPSELAKISLVLYLAYYLEKKRGRVHDWKTLILPVSVMGGFALLILKEPDYGTALLVCAIGGMMLYLGGARILHLSVLGAGAVALFVLYLFSASYRVERITGFVSTQKDIMGRDFQPYQAKLAVGSGGLFGVSLGESTQKLDFLPYAHTDFIYAILGEEFGLLGTLTILSLFIVVLWRGLTVASRAPTMAARLAAMGLTLILTVQALLNITVVLGLGPAKGVPLPLVSFGRSSLVCSLVSIAILLNISQRRRIKRYGIERFGR
jgi:cell division protein FtsW